MDEREQTLRHDGLLVGIAGLALLSGMHFSPYFDPAFLLVKFFGPAFFVGSPLVLFYFTSLLVSTTALILAGVPAAIFERVTGRKESDWASLTVWLAGTALIAMPALVRSGG
ncbi:MAG TPA: hypothetical protein VM434_18040 [Beijerinckiaceae bacterium]|nr:hypothetical protein [Beijerinckiaceae bacterium]